MGHFLIPPLRIPNVQGRPFKTVVVDSLDPLTIRSFWHHPEDVMEPHSHPWDFTLEVLSGNIVMLRFTAPEGHSRWECDRPAPVRCEEVSLRQGETLEVPQTAYIRIAGVAPSTVTRMVCGPHEGGWGYLDMFSGEHIPSFIDPRYQARFRALNPDAKDPFAKHARDLPI